MKCSRCDHELPVNKAKCSNCGKWNMRIDDNVIAPSKEGEDADGSITLDRVKSEDAERIKSGPWDHMWGTTIYDNGDEVSGIVQTSTTLIGGSPGAGKTTLLLQMCSNVAIAMDAQRRHETFDKVSFNKTVGLVHIPARTRDEVLYIAAEQSLPEIKLTADRLKLKAAHRIRMVPAMGGTANIAGILNRRQPRLVVLDSLQGLCGKDDAAQIEVCDIVKGYAIRLKAPIIMVSQVTKDGEMAGLMTLQHHVDTTMSLFPDDDGIRVQEVMKNRFGRAFITQEYTLTEKGLAVHIPEDDDEDEDDELEEED